MNGSGSDTHISRTSSNKLFSIEEIDLTGTGSNSVALTAQDVLETSDTDEMRILGNAGDSVTSVGQAWIQEPTR